MEKCSVDGCEKKKYLKGWCTKHYQRWKRLGDPLKGMDIAEKGAALKYLKETVLKFDKDECLIWPFFKAAYGYGKIHINGKMKTVHIVVCEIINGPKPDGKFYAIHSCGNGHLGCCAPKHIKWGTNSENQMDRVRHGTSNRGSRHGMSKLTENDVRQIRNSTSSQGELAKTFGIDQSTVSDIKRRKRWSWLE